MFFIKWLKLENLLIRTLLHGMDRCTGRTQNVTFLDCFLLRGKSITFLHLQNNLHLLMGSHNKNFLHYTHLLYLMPVCVCKSLEIKKSSQIVTFLDCFLLRGKAIYFGIYKIIYMYLWAAASK